MKRSSPIVLRAVLALALMVGFYLLALGIAAALFTVPFLEYQLLGRVHGKLALLAVVGAGSVVWAVLPRRDRFESPGPRLEPDEHPRLFQAIREVARATGQAMPAEVYFVPQLNAWVAQRGGVMGLGSRRVMGLGLPLLQSLSVTQLRAVLAHEFGHYHGGDTRLGPWIYTTRAAIGRTLLQLERQGSSVLAKPFQWYGTAFLRITHAVSRQQEYAADELAARTVGAQALAAALRRLHGAAGVFDSYWSDELAPVLRQGMRPPIAEGFGRYLGAPGVASVSAEALAEAMARGGADPDDTHPSLGERLRALEAAADGLPDIDPPAITLLDDVSELERRLLAQIGGPDAPPLQPAGWDEVGTRAWLPFWRERLAPRAAGLRGLAIAELPAAASDLPALAVRLNVADPGEEVTAEQTRGAAWIVGAALCVALGERGWRVSALPGEEVVLRFGSDTVRPFAVLHDLGTGDLQPAVWLALCHRAGLARVDLGLAVAPEAGPARRRRAWSFIALEYHALVLNRVYRVIVTERAVCGARVRGPVMSPLFPPGEPWEDPEFYPSRALQERYMKLDPESAEFLAIDRANFRYELAALAEVEFVARPKWGMGSIPYSGRLRLRLRDGGRRELILLGRQSGPALRAALAGAAGLA